MWLGCVEEVRGIGGVQLDGVSESGAVQVLAGELVFFGRVVDGVDGDTESYGGAEQPES